MGSVGSLSTGQLWRGPLSPGKMGLGTSLGVGGWGELISVCNSLLETAGGSCPSPPPLPPHAVFARLPTWQRQEGQVAVVRPAVGQVLCAPLPTPSRLPSLSSLSAHCLAVVCMSLHIVTVTCFLLLECCWRAGLALVFWAGIHWGTVCFGGHLRARPTANRAAARVFVPNG